jgi:DNA-directed RNA polymerase subunit L
LGRALRETEQAVEALWDLDDPAIMKLSFTVSWGATYDPESMLEHAIVHLLRHRRQVERWLG